MRDLDLSGNRHTAEGKRTPDRQGRNHLQAQREEVGRKYEESEAETEVDRRKL